MQASIHAAARLKSARLAAGLGQKQAAALCGVSFSAWNKWERGASPVPRPTLVGCLVILGVPAKTALAAR